MGSYATIVGNSVCYFFIFIIIVFGCLIQSGSGDESIAVQKERLILYTGNGLNVSSDPSFYNSSLNDPEVAIVLNETELGFIVIESPVNESNYYKNEFSKIPWVSLIEPDIIRYPAVLSSITPDDPDFSDQWALNRTNIQEAWTLLSNSSGSSNITIAIIDTGIDVNHEDLSERINPNGKNWIDNGSDLQDSDGHGTFLAGIVSAVTNNGKGISGISLSSILPERVGSNKSGIYVSFSAAAIKHAADQGARVILLGYGGPGQSMAEESAIRYASSKGTIIIAPAGNENSNQAHYPSDSDYVISVGSTSKTDGLSYFSNYGIFIDFVAPGENIISTWINNTYHTAAGTSAAAAMVTGAVALMLQEDPTLTPDETTEILSSTVIDLGRSGKDIYYGYGLLDIGDAVKKTQYQLHAKRGKISYKNTSNNSDSTLLWNTKGSSLLINETVRRKEFNNLRSTVILLNHGWNFLSLPAIPGSGKTSGEIFASINTDGHTIWKYDSVNKDWISIEKDTNITPLEGFLIYSDKQTTLPFVLDQQKENYSITMKPGWNLVGSPYWDTVNASICMGTESSKWVSMLFFNSSLQAYDPAIIRGASGIHSDLRKIPAFSAFWVYIKDEVTLQKPQ